MYLLSPLLCVPLGQAGLWTRICQLWSLRENEHQQCPVYFELKEKGGKQRKQQTGQRREAKDTVVAYLLCYLNLWWPELVYWHMPIVLASEKPRQENGCKFKTSLFWFVCFLNKILSKNSINNKRYLPSWTRKLMREQEVIFSAEAEWATSNRGCAGWTGTGVGWGGVSARWLCLPKPSASLMHQSHSSYSLSKARGTLQSSAGPCEIYSAQGMCRMVWFNRAATQ